MDTVFHYTDSLRLPWIIRAKQLNPGLNRVSNLPSTFLWATTSPDTDRSSSASGTSNAREAFRRGLTAQVRLTLPGNAFQNWSNVSRLYPEWTADQVERTEALARKRHGEMNCDAWRIRRDPLDVSQVIAVEYRTYAVNRWLPADKALLCIPVIAENDRTADLGGVVLGDWAYLSQRIDIPGEPIGYIPMNRLSADEFNEQSRVIITADS